MNSKFEEKQMRRSGKTKNKRGRKKIPFKDMLIYDEKKKAKGFRQRR
jgi:hypothetical protein